MRELNARIQLVRARRSCRRHGHEWSAWEVKEDTRFQYRVCLVCPEREERTAAAAALEQIGQRFMAGAEAAMQVVAASLPAPRQRSAGLFDPDRGPSSTVPGSVLLAAGVDPAQPSPLAPHVLRQVTEELHAAPPREHDIGLPVPAVPACPGHERVIRELRAEVRRLDAENWRLRHGSQAGPTEQRDGNGSTTSAGRDTGRPTQGAGDAAGDQVRVGTVDRAPEPPRNADLSEGGGAADGD